MRTACYPIALVLGLALTLGAVPAQAETTACTPVTAVPTVITAQGIYCFTQHLNTDITTGNAIEIQTNNVILDLNGFKLGGLAAGPSTLATGIHATDRQNITIKNGTVRGFLNGIFLQGSASGGHVVEDIRADQNTQVGMQVVGDGSLIRNNQVVATGGTTISAAADGFGIIAGGIGLRVLNNDVIDVKSVGGGTAWGVFFNGVSGLAANNRITNADVGINNAAKYSDNLTTGVTTPFSGGTAVGVND